MNVSPSAASCYFLNIYSFRFYEHIGLCLFFFFYLNYRILLLFILHVTFHDLLWHGLWPHLSYFKTGWSLYFAYETAVLLAFIVFIYIFFNESRAYTISTPSHRSMIDKGGYQRRCIAAGFQLMLLREKGDRSERPFLYSCWKIGVWIRTMAITHGD